MLRTLEGLKEGTLTARVQDHAAATLAPILTREDGRLDVERRTARECYNRWRGFCPWPGAWAEFRGKRFLVHAMRPAEREVEPLLEPGELQVRGSELLAGAAQGTAIVLREVQIEGKPRLAGVAFARDFQLKQGERLG